MNSVQLEAWLEEVVAAHREQRPIHDELLTGANECAEEMRKQWAQVAALRAKTKYAADRESEKGWEAERVRIANASNSVATALFLLADSLDEVRLIGEARLLRIFARTAYDCVPDDLAVDVSEALNVRALQSAVQSMMFEDLSDAIDWSLFDAEIAAVGICRELVQLEQLRVSVQRGRRRTEMVSEMEKIEGRLAGLLPGHLWRAAQEEVEREEERDAGGAAESTPQRNP